MFLHLLRCYTGSTRAALGPRLEYINNTVNTPYVGLRKKGLHILEHTQFLYTSAYIPRVSALTYVRRLTMPNIHKNVSIETDAIAPSLVWHCLTTPKMCKWAFNRGQHPLILILNWACWKYPQYTGAFSESAKQRKLVTKPASNTLTCSIEDPLGLTPCPYDQSNSS